VNSKCLNRSSRTRNCSSGDIFRYSFSNSSIMRPGIARPSIPKERGHYTREERAYEGPESDTHSAAPIGAASLVGFVKQKLVIFSSLDLLNLRALFYRTVNNYLPTLSWGMASRVP